MRTDPRGRLARTWREFADTECGTYSPLYAAICRSVADDADLLGMVASAPPSGQQPNVLLAAAHYLLLGGVEHPLGDAYTGSADPALAPALFRDLCLAHREDIDELLRTRHTQTNEPGRTAVLAFGLAAAAGLIGEPIGLLDAGCSAGLNLLLDRYRFDFGPNGGLGPDDSTVTITSELRGAVSVPTRLPVIAARLGIDRAPVDITRPDDARWLLACVWPDTGRLPRTAAAIDLARRHPPRMIAGDVVDDLDAAIDTFEPGLPIVVVTTSVCGYLTVEQRRAFVVALARRAGRQPLTWLSVDAPGVLDLVPCPPLDGDDGTFASVAVLVTFEGGQAVGRALGRCQSHGAWLELTASESGTTTIGRLPTIATAESLYSPQRPAVEPRTEASDPQTAETTAL